MTTIFFPISIFFAISMIIIFICHYKNDKATKEIIKKIEKFDDYKLECNFNEYYKKIIRYHTLRSLFSIYIGFCIAIGLWYNFFMIEGVKEYIRGNVEVKYHQTYEDSVLVKSDTIINLK